MAGTFSLNITVKYEMVIDKEDMEIMRTGLMKFFVKNARSSLDLAGSLKLVITKDL